MDGLVRGHAPNTSSVLPWVLQISETETAIIRVPCSAMCAHDYCHLAFASIAGFWGFRVEEIFRHAAAVLADKFMAERFIYRKPPLREVGGFLLTLLPCFSTHRGEPRCPLLGLRSEFWYD